MRVATSSNTFSRPTAAGQARLGAFWKGAGVFLLSRAEGRSGSFFDRSRNCPFRIVLVEPKQVEGASFFLVSAVNLPTASSYANSGLRRRNAAQRLEVDETLIALALSK